jgi:glycine/D-amino acid oxidase-like deaminating enzyme
VATEFEVVIAGGGVMGSSCAYFLHSSGDFRGSIAVVEPDPSYREAASTRSASSIRQQFSTPLNIALSMFGLDFLRAAPRLLQQAGTVPDLSLVESTYLYLATSEGRRALEERVSVQQLSGVPVRLHDREALAARYRWLHTADLAAGSDTTAGEGWFDGHALLAALRAANLRAGVRYLRDRVIGLEQSGGRIVAAQLQAAGRLPCRYAVNTTGTRARELAASVGVDLPVFPRKRHVFVFSSPVAIAPCPLVIDPSGLWFRPERDRFLCGPPAEPDPDVAADDFEVDVALFENQAWPLLAHRVPAFEAVRLQSAWVGHYDYNTFDQNAFVGPVPAIPNFLLANGFSGHGLQQSPGVGRGLAEYIRFGRYRTLDLTPLSYARFLANAPLREFNVI